MLHDALVWRKNSICEPQSQPPIVTQAIRMEIKCCTTQVNDNDQISFHQSYECISVLYSTPNEQQHVDMHMYTSSK